MNPDKALPSLRAEFEPPVRHLGEVLRGIRAGRATTGLVENVEVEAYGSRMLLKSLASISTPNSQTIQVDPWDKAHVKEIEKALATSPIGIHPVTAGTTIRLTIPALTEERRTELAKLVRKRLEESKVSIRSIRERFLRDLRARQEAGTLSDDAFERERKSLQEDTDVAVATAENLGKTKGQELLTA